jgi:hypothetical protein
VEHTPELVVLGLPAKGNHAERSRKFHCQQCPLRIIHHLKDLVSWVAEDRQTSKPVHRRGERAKAGFLKTLRLRLEENPPELVLLRLPGKGRSGERSRNFEPK